MSAKQILMLAIIILLVSSIAVADNKAPKGTTKPTSTTPGTTTVPQGGYVLTQDRTVTDKDGKQVTYPAGTLLYGTLTHTEALASDSPYSQKVSPDTVNYLKSHPDWQWDGSTNTFTWSTTKKNEGTFIDYETTKMTTLNLDGTRTDQETTVECKNRDCSEFKFVSHYERTYKTEPIEGDKTGATRVTDEITPIYAGEIKVEKDANGNLIVTTPPVATMDVHRSATDPKSSRTEPDKVTVTGADGTKYYEYEKGKGVTESNGGIDKIPGLTDEQKDQVRVDIVNSGAVSFGGALETLTTAQSLGRLIKAYNDYRGLIQLTNLLWPGGEDEVARRKAEIQQQFCLAAGIENCATSIICGRITNIDQTDNILVGRGPGGQYVASAALNAERSLAVELEGMTRQQLIDLLGNVSTIKGRIFDFTDPKFDPKILGKIKLRLYHVQYSITNNAESQDELNYNIVFKTVPEEINSSYGTPMSEAPWYGKKWPGIAYGESAKDNLYKWSATEYSDVCLRFNPGLPTGNAAGNFFNVHLTNELCVPFQEYQGESTTIQPSTTPGVATPIGEAGSAPGALV